MRPTRFHTEGGGFVGWSALPGLVPAAATWVWKRATGKYLLRPWWAWEAIRFVERNLQLNDRVLEVGSGYSSLWLARRSSQVWSIEESSEWEERVTAEAERVKLPNLTIIGGDSLTGFSRLLYENDYDVVIIDGPRDRMKIFEKLLNTETANRPRLIIYDDTDNIENRKALAKSVTGYETYVFRGFKPQTVHACETTVFRYNSI